MLLVLAWVGTSTALREMSRLRLREYSDCSGGGGSGLNGGQGGNVGYKRFGK